MSSDEKGKELLDSFFEHLSKQYLEESKDSGFYNYLLKKQNISKWLVLSDYVVKDKYKSNDAFCLTICPYTPELADANIYSAVIPPKDIKNIRVVDSNYLKFLSSGLFFHFCVIPTSFTDLAPDSDYAIKQIDKMISMHNDIAKSHPDKTDIIERKVSKLRLLKQKMNQKSFNINLYRRVLFLSFMIGFIFYSISKITKAEQIGWFSDRDTMISVWNDLAFELMPDNFNGMCEKGNILRSDIEVILGVPEKEGKMWYDHLVRIPDYIVGTFADFDYVENRASEKFIPIIEDLGTNQEIFHLTKIGLHRGMVEHKLVHFAKE